MGLKSWFSKKNKPAVEEAAPAASRPLFPFEMGLPSGKDVEVSGTTTFAHDGVLTLMQRRRLTGERGYLEGSATLQHDPDNPVDADAVEVLVDGLRVGCLSMGLGKELREHTSKPVDASYQLHTLREGTKVQAKAFVWLDNSQPDWRYSKCAPAPLTSDARAQESGREKTRMVKEGLKAGGTRQKQFENALVGGIHYLELAEPIKQLKREGKLREALELCYVAIESAEKDSRGSSPAPAYTTQAAIVHRKLGERDEEIAVQKRWLAASPEQHRESSAAAERLAKLEAPKK